MRLSLRTSRGVLLLVTAITTAPAYSAAAEVWPLPQWAKTTAQEAGMDAASLRKVRDYALTGDGSGYITRGGKLVMSWGDPRKRYDLKSTTKSIGVTVLGLAISDGKMRLTDKVASHHPSFGTPPESNTRTGWKGQRILPSEFVAQARTTVKGVVGLPEVDPQRYGNASDHYGLLWWNNADGTLSQIPRDAYWSWGLYDSLIVVIPSLDIVVARAGKSWKRNWSGHYDVLRPFLDPIAASVRER